MGLFLKGGNRAVKAEDAGDSKEGFGVCGEEKLNYFPPKTISNLGK